MKPVGPLRNRVHARVGVRESLAVAEDLFIESSAPEVRLHLRHKRPSGGRRVGQRRAIIFVHGATYCGVSAYDAPLPGGSWLDFAAARGFDTYALSVRGYGHSLMPPASSSDLMRDGAYARTSDAVDDLESAVNFVRAHASVDQVDLVGWSWGTSICGSYVIRAPAFVRRLVMFAPLWILRGHVAGWPFGGRLPMLMVPMVGSILGAGLAPFRSVTLEEIRERCFRGLDAQTAATLFPPDQMATWWRHALKASGHDATALRAPNGVMADLLEYWASGVPMYDPAGIPVPSLLVVGEWDRDTPPSMAQELYTRLDAGGLKRLEVLARGTHTMSLEVGRFELYERVQRFLEEST